MTTGPAVNRRRLIATLVACASPLIILPGAEYLAVAPFGSFAAQCPQTCLQLLALPLLLVALVAPLVAVILLLSRQSRRTGARWLLASLLLIVATLVGLRAGDGVRMRAFHQLAERSEPLVQAIKAYEARHGVPPPALESLVPEYLPSVPGTRMAAYPSHSYEAGAKANRYDGNPWVLTVQTPAGVLNFDQFMYFPLQNYPATGYGGGLERVRDWAYVHE